MALVLADRVRDTTTTAGTGTVTLSGTAPSGYQTFGAAIGNGNTTYYTISGGSEWEVGIGTYTASGTTLSRDTVLASSAGGTTKVTFSAGTKDVFVTYPAEKSVNYDASGNVGIGTTAPSAKLAVIGRIDATNTQSFLFNGTTGTYGSFQYNGTIVGDIGTANQVISGASNTNFGITTRSTTSLLFGTNTTERMRVEGSNGYVGIGTTYPAYNKLNIGDDATGSATVGMSFTTALTERGSITQAGGTGQMTISAGYTSWGGRIVFQTNGAERMRIDESGNIAVGTSSPTAISGYTSVSINNGTNGAILDLMQAGTMRGRFVATTSALVAETSGSIPIVFSPTGTEKMRIDSSGNVGIGTTSPGAKLDVAGTNGNVQVNATGDQIAYTYNGFNYLTAAGAAATLQIQASGASGKLIFATAGSEKMRLATAGNLLIGKSSASGLGELLGVNRTSDGHTAMFGRSGGSQNPYMRFFVTDSGCISSIDANGSAGLPALALGANSTEIIRLTSGRAGIGQNTPGATLDVNGASCQNIVAVSASAVDCATGNYFTKTASGALTWTFTNVPTSRSFIFALQLTNGGSGTQTWPAAVVWNGGTAPTLQTSGTDILIFITSDSGTTWRGVRGWKQA